MNAKIEKVTGYKVNGKIYPTEKEALVACQSEIDNHWNDLIFYTEEGLESIEINDLKEFVLKYGIEEVENQLKGQ